MHSHHPNRTPSKQSGAVLLVAVVLLLLAGLMTLFALNVGMFEQRSTANDLRGKMVNDVAEGGLSHGFEFLMRQNRGWMDTTTRWELCQPTDTKFPCGAIPQFEPGTTTPRRATMYRYKGTAGSIANISDDLDKYMLPLANTISTVAGGFNVAYGVAPVLCFVKKPLVSDPVDTPVRCTTTIAKATKQRIATFVSVASIPGEAARTTLTQAVGQYALLDNLLGKPPITAAGSVDLTGTLQIVTNPDGGGPGVPVSVWTRRNIQKTGTPNTCYADEFFRYGAKGGPGGTPALVDGILTCNACGCDSDKSLSYDDSGNSQDEGMDILDIDGNTAGTPIAKQINYDVVPSEFPCDLFEYTFGVKSWSDGGLPDPPYDDYFCEKKITAAYTPSWNQAVTRTIGVDEAYLYKNAKYIMSNGLADALAILPGSGKTTGFTYPSASMSGMVWCQTGCGIGPAQTLGSPSKPVILVADGDTLIQGTVFGLVFIRSTGTADLSATSGGNAPLRLNGKAAIYGAVVVQGLIEKANGTAAVIHSTEVLEGLGNSDDNIKNVALPGAWTDLKSY